MAPAGTGIKISVVDVEKATIASAAADVHTGRFHFAIAPGMYDVNVQSPGSPFPLVFTSVVVRPGETTTLGRIQLGLSPAGTASISGRIKPGSPETVVALLSESEGIERASVHADAQGSFRIEHLPPGPYTLHVRTPGYANETATVILRDGGQLKQDIRQLYITAIEGIDWNAGILRARGVGLPPGQSPTPTVRREMAKRAALADAERNLLRTIELLHVGPEQKLSDLLGERVFARHLQGYLRGYRIAADRDLSGGRVEIELEMPLTGPQGLTVSLHER